MICSSVVKKVVINFMKLNDQGFRPGVTNVRELAYHYDVLLDNQLTGDMFKLECQKIIGHNSISKWENWIDSPNKYPILWAYRILRTKYEKKTYLYLLKNLKYGMTISKCRSSSHILEIETGRHTRPIAQLENKLFPSCKEFENGIRFLLECFIYECYRRELFNKVLSVNHMSKICSC